MPLQQLLRQSTENTGALSHGFANGNVYVRSLFQKMNIVTYFLFLNLIKLCFGYKILVMFPFPFKSHGILGKAVVRHLVNAGHEVTFVSPYSVKESFPNVHEVILNTTKITEKRRSLYTCLVESKTSTDIYIAFPKLLNVTKATLADDNFVRFINDNTADYDLVIVEFMFNDVYSGLSAVFQCPFIWFFTLDTDLDIMRLMIHELPSPATSTNFRTLNISPLNFLERLRELWFQTVYLFYMQFYFYPKEKELYEKSFGPVVNSKGRELPPYNDVRYNASLAFCNTHKSLKNRHIDPVNLKLIGGYHINDEKKPLPQNFRYIMDNSTDGVIIFSMGSILDPIDMPVEWKKEILNVFGSLNQTVLWRTNEKLKSVPANVKVVPWLPQQQILAHNRCILLITHGGLLSISESVYYGVPIIGIPAFADQFFNMKLVEKYGYGRKVDLALNMAANLNEAIRDVLNNPIYASKAKERSTFFHDRKLPPSEELVHWVEHVIKTRGAPHLRSNTFMLPWYQRYLELYVLFIIIMFLILYTFKCFIKMNLKLKTKIQ